MDARPQYQPPAYCFMLEMQFKCQVLSYGKTLYPKMVFSEPEQFPGFIISFSVKQTAEMKKWLFRAVLFQSIDRFVASCRYVPREQSVLFV